MDLGGFSEESIDSIENMLFSEQQKFIRPKGKKCPPGTRPKNKWCENPKPGKNFYLDAKGGCPPGTRPGGGFCKGEYAETPNPLEGQCGQKKKKEAAAKPRTPEQQQADRERAQDMRGQDNVPSGVRQQAAAKAAKTRAKCTGNKPKPPTTPGTNFNEALVDLLWEYKLCGESAIPEHKKCHKEVVAHVAEHVGKGVVAWKTGKILGTAVASALESRYGIPREASQKIAETVIQAATMTALEAKHLKTADQWAKKVVVEAAAAFLGKTAHAGAEHAMSAMEMKKIIEQAAPVLAGKVTGIGTAVAGSKLPGPGAMVKTVIERSANDTKMLMDMFAHRKLAFAEMDGAADLLADLGIIAIVAAYNRRSAAG